MTKTNDETLATLTSEILERDGRARSSSESSLQEYRAIGEALLTAKPLLRGQYLEWAKASLGYSKQWCHRLTQIARSWDDYVEAQSWAGVEGIRVEYSVDGALALIRRWRRAADPETPDASASSKRSNVRDLKARIVSLEQQLEEARAEIARLRPSSGGVAAPSRRVPLDDATRALARKIGAVWACPGAHAGERASSEGRLRHLASKFGWRFDEFLRECGIEVQGDWTSAKAA